MPEQGPDLPDPDQWLKAYTSDLGGIANLTGPSATPRRGPDGILRKFRQPGDKGEIVK